MKTTFIAAIPENHLVLDEHQSYTPYFNPKQSPIKQIKQIKTKKGGVLFAITTNSKNIITSLRATYASFDVMAEVMYYRNSARTIGAMSASEEELAMSLHRASTIVLSDENENIIYSPVRWPDEASMISYLATAKRTICASKEDIIKSVLGVFGYSSFAHLDCKEEPAQEPIIEDLLSLI